MSTAPSSSSSGTKRPLYESSTQFKNWRFSSQYLSESRNKLNHAAIEVIRKKIETDQPGSSSGVAFLNSDEEIALIKLYLTKIPQICGLFGFPEEAEATAISYMKRFYLKNTVMDWHPKSVMLTTLFLATKTTNNPISLEAYVSRIPKTTTSDVLDLEFLVAQSLGFEFAVWHAHRALWGMWLDIQSIPDGPKPETVYYETACSHIRASRLTDAEFLYTPSQIALACLQLSDRALARRWVESKYPTTSSSNADSSSEQAEEAQKVITATTDAIAEMIKQHGREPDVEVVREVDRRLRLCKNPEKVPGSKAFLAKKAEEEKKAEQKRNKKAEEEILKMNSNDPFSAAAAPKTSLVDYDDEDDDDDE